MSRKRLPPFALLRYRRAFSGSWARREDRVDRMSLPARLGRYEIERELGKGAMGRVFLAHDPAIDRKVALKTIHLPEGLSSEARADALRTRTGERDEDASRCVLGRR